MKNRFFRLSGVLFILALMVSTGWSKESREDLNLKRELLDSPLIFVKGHNYQGLHIYDTFYQWRPGGGIYLLENPADEQKNYRIRPIIDATTPETLGEGFYFDPSLSFDATKLLFSFKGEAGGGSSIYEIGVDGRGLRQISRQEGCADYCGAGSGHHDVTPAYLPDGRIVFTSTRFSGLVPCANNGVAILHVMNADGSDVHSISVNNVTEFDPAVLPDGRILFGRWEYIDKNALTIQSLWTILPDGTNETALFANNMVFPEAILQAKPVPDSPLIVGTFAPHNAPPRGAVAMIDPRGGKNDEKAIINFEHPDSPTYDRGESRDPWPLDEQTVLCSGRPSGDFNQLMILDRQGKMTKILSDPTIDLHHPIPLKPRPVPQVRVDTIDPTQKSGSFFVHDVYAGMPDVPRGSVKWLRVIEETSRISPTPGSNGLNQTFSISAALAWSAKIYHGMVPVEENGSVFFEAPSGRALYFQLLDDDYRLVRSMRSFVKAAPGTTRSCTGCHEYDPPKALGIEEFRLPQEKPKKLVNESWGSGYLNYYEKIQPIFDAKCIVCHGEEAIAAGLDLSGSPSEIFNISYDNLTSRRETQYHVDLISGICCMNGTAYWSCKIFDPYEHGTGNAPLADRVLHDDLHRDLLTREEQEILFTWIDSNGLYYGTWDYTWFGPLVNAWAPAKTELVKLMEQNRCAECHTDSAGKVVRFENDWINLQYPEKSRILRAPQAKPDHFDGADPNRYGLAVCRNRPLDQQFRRLGIMSGGQYEHAVRELDQFPTQVWQPVTGEGEPIVTFESTANPLYQQMLAVINKAKEQAMANPRVDFCPPDKIDLINAGRPRMMNPPAIPTDPVPFQVVGLPDGSNLLKWECSAATIGLASQIHRGTPCNFTPSKETLIGETERFEFLDKTPVKDGCYRVLFVPREDVLY